MSKDRLRRNRRGAGPGRWTLVTSGVLVLAIGVLGLLSARAGGQLAVDQHRDDRASGQRVLGSLSTMAAYGGYTQLSQLLKVQESSGVRRFSATPSTGADLRRDVARIAGIVKGSGQVSDVAGAVVNSRGQVVASYSPTGSLPSLTSPGFSPLIDAVRSPGTTLPLSGILRIGTEPAVASGAPTTLSDGSKGLFLRFWTPRNSLTQAYTAAASGRSVKGFVVDHAGILVAGPDAAMVGTAVPHAQAYSQAMQGDSGIVDTDEADGEYVTAWSRVKGTTWMVMSTEPKSSFQGHLDAASRRTAAAVGAMLLIAGASLVVTARRRERVMAVLATTDELTTIHNRRGWFSLAERELARAERAQERRLALFLDLDGLKQVNDRLGHEEGDRAIASAARVLRSICRPGDLLGRLGGDEFVVLLGEGADPASARHRVWEALEQFNATSDAAFELRLSIGAEMWNPDEPISVDELVRRADERMYEDKRSRVNRYEGLLRVHRSGAPADRMVSLPR